MRWGELAVHGVLLVIFSLLAIWNIRFARLMRDKNSPIRVALRAASRWQERFMLVVFPLIMFVVFSQVFVSVVSILKLLFSS